MEAKATSDMKAAIEKAELEVKAAKDEAAAATARAANAEDKVRGCCCLFLGMSIASDVLLAVVDSMDRHEIVIPGEANDAKDRRRATETSRVGRGVPQRAALRRTPVHCLVLPVLMDID